jgi:hypothetical protein
VDRILPELRRALHEHVRLAKDSLEVEASNIAMLEGKSHQGWKKAPQAKEVVLKLSGRRFWHRWIVPTARVRAFLLVCAEKK